MTDVAAPSPPSPRAPRRLARALLVRAARFHRASRDWFFDGEMRHPGSLACETLSVDFPVRGIYTAAKDFRAVRDLVVPAVLHSVWRSFRLSAPLRGDGAI